MLLVMQSWLVLLVVCLVVGCRSVVVCFFVFCSSLLVVCCWLFVCVVSWLFLLMFWGAGHYLFVCWLWLLV